VRGEEKVRSRACITRRKKVNVPVSQICALIVLPSVWIDFVANSTPMVDFDSRLNSSRVNRLSRFDLPTPESPIKTTYEAHRRAPTQQHVAHKGSAGEGRGG
jgi:hypothetical protein